MSGLNDQLGLLAIAFRCELQISKSLQISKPLLHVHLHLHTQISKLHRYKIPAPSCEQAAVNMHPGNMKVEIMFTGSYSGILL